MQSKNYYNVTVIKPINQEKITSRYTEAVFKIVKNKLVTKLTIEKLIEKLEGDRSDEFEGSRNI